jgi:hypothetical protein
MGLHLALEKSQPPVHRRLDLGLVLLQQHRADELEDCRVVAQAVDLLLDAFVFLALRFQGLQLLDVLGDLWMALESVVSWRRRTLLQLLVLLRQRLERLAWISHFQYQARRRSGLIEARERKSDMPSRVFLVAQAGCCAGVRRPTRPGLLGSGMINIRRLSRSAPFLSAISCLHVCV